MTTTELARRPSTAMVVAEPAAMVVQFEEAPKPTMYRLVNPWRTAVIAAGGLSAATLTGGVVASRIDLDLLPHAAGAGVGSLALLLAATGLHSRFSNRVRSRDKFVEIKP